MKLRFGIGLLLFWSVSLLFLLPPVHAQDELRLKPGARGEVCFTCHVAFEEKLKREHVHTPVKIGQCSGCHNPHASAHGKLLDAEPEDICYNCHAEMVPKGARSAHKVVVEGNCVDCHDPHASDYSYNLVRGGNELCFGCHEDMGEALADLEFKHSPVEGGCLQCHNPHASEKNEMLLAESVPPLCLKCHQTDKPIFRQIHENYPVSEARCTSCHNPHGSNTGAILYDNVHQPVSAKMCNQCHQDSGSSAPLKLQKEGYELCGSCHYDMVNDALNKKRLHWPLVDEEGCVNCHSPHASSYAKLLKDSTIDVCGECHADTITRQERSQTKHVPIAEGQCGVCHFPHSSDNLFLLNQESVINVCGTCHDWQAHSTHPIGEEVTDPRNENLTLNCLSCHRSHGTEFKNMLYYETTTDLCVQCHVQFRR
jgi:DmsE family decaheme c-type cytochrome